MAIAFFFFFAKQQVIEAYYKEKSHTEKDLEKEGIYITPSNIFMPHHNNNDYYFNIKDDEWFNVKDNIFIDSNWTQEVPQ